VVVHGLAVAREPGHDDGPLAVEPGDEDRAGASVGDDDARLAHQLDEPAERDVLVALRATRPDPRRAVLDDDALLAEPLDLAQQPVEGSTVRPSRDEDHAPSRTVPA
jgi:hypothetical protein